MDNEIESLRQKLALERRASRIAEIGFLIGAMAFAWGVHWYCQANSVSANVLAVGVGCAISGAVLATLSAWVYRIRMYKKWKSAHGQRFGRVLHSEQVEEADWK